MPATQNAIYTEMLSTGVADKIMTADNVDDADMTFWRFVHAKHTPYAQEPTTFGESGTQAKFNGAAKYAFPKTADLAWQTYAVANIPAIVAIKDGKVCRGEDAARWVQAVGQKYINEAHLSVGTTPLETLTDVYMYSHEVLTGKPGKKLGEMIGKFATVEERQKFAKRSQTLYTPLPFTYTTNSGLALPLASLQFNTPVIALDFDSRQNLIEAPDGAQIYVRPDGVTDDAIEAGIDAAGKPSLSLLQDGDLKVEILANMIWLEEDERTRFNKGAFEQVIDEVQLINHQVVANSLAVNATEGSQPVKANVDLKFSNICTEYYFFVRSQAKAEAKQWFDFSGPVDANGITLDPIRLNTIKFGNSPRVQQMPGSYWRQVQPYQHHTNLPVGEFIYCWNYGMDSEDAQPNGGANHSRIENINMEVLLDARIFTQLCPTAELFVFAKSKNLIRYKFGVLTRRFL